MKYLITGYSGQLGYDIYRELIKRGVNETDILCPSSTMMNIKNFDDISQIVSKFKPDVIYHCAAYTKVDLAEEESYKCMMINAIGTKNMVDAARMVNAKILCVSSDYVFDGEKQGIYTEKDQTNPLNVYGKSKQYSELVTSDYEKGFVIRTSWVFGKNGNNFIKTMIKLSQNHDSIKVVNDQIGSPTYTPDLAKIMVDLSYTESYGVYNITNENYCSWSQFANYIMSTIGSNTKIIGVSTEEYYQGKNSKVAQRPKNSKLSKEKIKSVLNIKKLPSWQEATEKYIKELELEKEKDESISNGCGKVYRK